MHAHLSVLSARENYERKTREESKQRQLIDCTFSSLFLSQNNHLFLNRGKTKGVQDDAKFLRDPQGYKENHQKHGTVKLVK